jgi:hypothetical protein
MKELLLLLCRYPFEEKNRETLSVLVREVKDWNQTTRLINAHGIIALAAYNIKEAGLEKEIPSDSMAFLEKGYRQNVVRNIWLTERWKEVNEILENARIKHILLKGMALEHTIYGARGLRQMNDNDILVKREEATKTWRLLQKNGFKINTPKSTLHLKIIKDLSYHLPALYKDGYAIEIHTKLFDHITSLKMDLPDLFTNAVEINIADKKALILHPETQLKYLIKHFERHMTAGESQLRSYADILMSNKGNPTSVFENKFIMNPDQKYKAEFRKAAYKAKVNFIHPKYRLQYILGDLFPSIAWMKERYGGGSMKAFLYYPHRLGKLVWLI